MVEARILCTCPFIWIADLNLSMMKGQEATIPEARARASSDLDIAVKSKGVTVSYQERYREIRPPVPREPEPAPHPPKEPPRVVTPPTVERMVLDEDVIAQKVADKMASLREPSVNAQIEALTIQVKLLQELLLQRSVSVPVSGGKVEDDRPVFIPETIMSGTTGEADLKVKETVSQGNVDEAANALRNLKRSRSR